ncbi:hypothetical protein [Levilactobacillus mulengensis]|uniref:hypothetical protein n=1 Tax=Levilactobacillus mulengensis TaxID=2486025 RepID=UPI000F77D84C|nr:hypothetical protein [Levilactobacillus mulengensis]
MHKLTKQALLTATLVTLTLGGLTVTGTTSASAAYAPRDTVPTALRGNWYAYNAKAKKYQHIKLTAKTYQFSVDHSKKSANWNFPYLKKGFTQSPTFKIKATGGKAFTMMSGNHGWTSFLAHNYTVSPDYQVTSLKFNGKKQKVLLAYIPTAGNQESALVYSHHKTHTQKVVHVKSSNLY